MRLIIKSFGVLCSTPSSTVLCCILSSTAEWVSTALTDCKKQQTLTTAQECNLPTKSLTLHCDISAWFALGTSLGKCGDTLQTHNTDKPIRHTFSFYGGMGGGRGSFLTLLASMPDSRHCPDAVCSNTPSLSHIPGITCTASQPPENSQERTLLLIYHPQETLHLLQSLRWCLATPVLIKHMQLVSWCFQPSQPQRIYPVSYTHLTLPTTILV